MIFQQRRRSPQGEGEGKERGRDESRTQRLKDGVWGRGTLSSSGAKSFLRGSVGSLNLPPPHPSVPAGMELLSQFSKEGNGDSEALSGAHQVGQSQERL